MRKLERKGEVLAPLLVQARQSAQLGRLEQRFLLQTRSLAFVDLISVLPLQKRTRFLSQELWLIPRYCGTRYV